MNTDVQAIENVIRFIYPESEFTWDNDRLVVKTGSAKTKNKTKTKTSSVKTKTISGKTKTKTKTELFEIKTKTKTANDSMKQNAHSSRKNYFYQKLQRH